MQTECKQILNRIFLVFKIETFDVSQAKNCRKKIVLNAFRHAVEINIRESLFFMKILIQKTFLSFSAILCFISLQEKTFFEKLNSKLLLDEEFHLSRLVIVSSYSSRNQTWEIQ